jgi:hypothetical protein
MWKSMKQRVYIIAALALINIAVMKYNEYKSGDKLSAWAVAKEGKIVTDSLLSQP